METTCRRDLLGGLIDRHHPPYQVELLERGKRFKPSPLKIQVANLFHHAARILQKPVELVSEWFVRSLFTPIRPGVEGNCESVFLEQVRRAGATAMSILLSPLTIGLFAVGEGLHALGNLTTGVPYTYLRGEADEKIDEGDLTCMTLNACMFWGGLPIPLGGLRPARQRIDDLAKLICKESPDLLVLQEMSFSSADALFKRIKGDYAHCYTRIGPNPFRMESSLTLFSKVAIQAPHFTPFPNQNGILRGAFSFLTPSTRFVTTHLEAGEAVSERKRQFDLITHKTANEPCFLLGDLNIARRSKVGDYEGTIGAHPGCVDLRADASEETQTNALTNHMRGKSIFTNLSETVDYVLLFGEKEGIHLKTKLIDTYSTKAPYKALSDHKGIVLTITRSR